MRPDEKLRKSLFEESTIPKENQIDSVRCKFCSKWRRNYSHKFSMSTGKIYLWGRFGSSQCFFKTEWLQVIFKGSSETELQTQAILFLKSMSERVGSDIERLWSLSIKGELLERLKIDWSHLNSERSMSDPPLSDIDCKNIMVLV